MTKSEKPQHFEVSKECPHCKQMVCLDSQTERMIKSDKDFSNIKCPNCAAQFTIVIGMMGVQVYEQLLTQPTHENSNL